MAEVTQNDDRRIPVAGSDEEAAILRLAAELDKVRGAWGGAIRVTSWYRPYAVNLAVGGVSNSFHLTGMAADIYPMSGDIYEFQDWLDHRWTQGGLGYGANRGFVHCDLGPYRRWDY